MYQGNKGTHTSILYSAHKYLHHLSLYLINVCSMRDHFYVYIITAHYYYSTYYINKGSHTSFGVMWGNTILQLSSALVK